MIEIIKIDNLNHCKIEAGRLLFFLKAVDVQ